MKTIWHLFSGVSSILEVVESRRLSGKIPELRWWFRGYAILAMSLATASRHSSTLHGSSRFPLQTSQAKSTQWLSLHFIYLFLDLRIPPFVFGSLISLLATRQSDLIYGWMREVRHSDHARKHSDAWRVMGVKITGQIELDMGRIVHKGVKEEAGHGCVAGLSS